MITGAAGGIGHACARVLAVGGADLLLTDLDQIRLDKLAGEISATAGRPVTVETFSGDLTRPDTRADLIALVAEAGGIDLLIPAAGIYPESPFQKISDEDWETVLSVNMTAVFTLTRDLSMHLRRGGAIVNFGSIAGARGSRNHSHYAATKGAIAAFTRSIAIELADRDIRANTVAPGIIQTSMTNNLVADVGDDLLKATPLHRFGTPEDVAGIVAFLCTDTAGFITGETIHVNGGLHMAS
ncbi:short chain dehydrogenase family protein 59 [Corynebacterium halotolerans YIM 70093 = DSM 44683]|uniref:3-oxoacyl-[acyl-carrier-protein] reductase MabA n=1 Tax=Corynebacterium halotolerans YIM 70093 = DSM 44683 TaxID=1121362 RepID=M1NI79_9CORY|nr:short chain dehydrogenase family protein 59 [Corynebacterium halotolerans YIM 70093 = DSM 44683]